MSEQTDSESSRDADLHPVIKVDDFADGERVLIEIDELEIAAFNIDGSYHAFANYCPHQGGPACEGRVSGILTTGGMDDNWELQYDREDEILSCPWHGWEFDMIYGELLANDNYSLISCETTVDDGVLYIVD